MTTFTVWGGTIPGGTSVTSTGSRTDGLEFDISSAGNTLQAVGWYAPSTETNLTGSNYTAQVYTTTTGTSGTLVTSNAGTGTFTAGAWNFITLASPVSLSTGTHYVAAIVSPNAIQFLSNYWSGGAGSGGTTSGPISVPGTATAPGGIQQGHASGAGFPGTGTGTWVGVDIQVTGGTARNATATLTVSPSLTATGSTGHSRTASLAVTPAGSASRSQGRLRTASRPVSPSVTAARTLGHFRTAAPVVSPSVSAARTRAAFRTAALTVSPPASASRSQGHARTAALGISPAITATRTAAHLRTASLSVAAVIAATGRNSGGAAVAFSYGVPYFRWAYGTPYPA